MPRVAGVAGGVGTSTVARFLRAADVGVYAGGPVEVLVCRSTASSALRASLAVGQGANPVGCRPVLAVVGDGPWPAPAAARARLHMLTPAVVAVIHLPYVAEWRAVDDPLGPTGPAPPRRLRAAVVKLVRAVEQAWATRTTVAGDTR